MGLIKKELIFVQAHCDSRVLHAPGECEYCDEYPKAQQRRIDLGVNFTSDNPDPNLKPCPAIQERDWYKINGWAGNQPFREDMTDEDAEYFDYIERGESKWFYGSIWDRLRRRRS